MGFPAQSPGAQPAQEQTPLLPPLQTPPQPLTGLPCCPAQRSGFALSAPLFKPLADRARPSSCRLFFQHSCFDYKNNSASAPEG